MPTGKTRSNCVTRFLKARDGVFSVEMGILIAPIAFTAIFAFDVARAYIIGSALDGAAIDLVTRARTGQLANVNRQQFCSEFNMSFCDMDKIGVRIEPLLSAGPSPRAGEFSINLPPGQTSMLVRVVYHTKPMMTFAQEPENFVVSAGAFTYAY